MWKHLADHKKWVKPAAFCCLLTACWLTAPEKHVLNARGADYIRVGMPDPGVRYLFSGYRSLMLEGDQVTWRHVLFFELGIVALFSAVSLLPRVPIVVALGGQAGLLSIWLIFQAERNHFHAVDSWAVVLSAGFIVALVFWRGRVWDYLTLIAYGTVLGYMPLARQSAHLVVVLPLMCILAFAALVGFARFILTRRSLSGNRSDANAEDTPGSSEDSSPLLRLCLPLVLFFVWVVVLQQVARAATTVDGKPVNVHGIGAPLYASLGFAANPYNIAWDDDITVSHGLLVDKVPWYHTNAKSQRRLAELWLDYVLEDPALVLRGILAKTAYLLRFFSGVSDLELIRKDGNPIRPCWMTTFVGVSFAVALGFFVWLAACVRREHMVALFAGTLGLFLASIGTLIIIVPFYLGSALAYCVVFVLVLTPAAWYCAKQVPQRADKAQVDASTFAYRVIFAVFACIVLGVAAFTVWRSALNRSEARTLLDERLTLQLQELGYEYAHRFNRLALDEQRQVLHNLLTAENEVVVYRGAHRPEEATERSQSFAPILAFLNDGVVYVAAWMSQDWEMTRLPSRLQGPRDSMIKVLRNTDKGNEKVRYFESPWSYLKIANANWDGRYRMFCLPQLFPKSLKSWAPKSLKRWAGRSSEFFAAPVEFFYVGAFNFKGGAHMSGLVVAPVGEGRLVRPNDGP